MHRIGLMLQIFGAAFFVVMAVVSFVRLHLQLRSPPPVTWPTIAGWVTVHVPWMSVGISTVVLGSALARLAK